MTLLAQPIVAPTASSQALPGSEEVTSKQLHHLLRLSGLPPPSSPFEESKMLQDLHAQLQFVRQIQEVDTTGIEPLHSIRDETTQAKEEATIGLESMKGALAAEEVVGRFHKRIRRRTQDVSEKAKEAEDWDVLGQAPKRVGRFFVVEGGEG